MTRIRPQQQQLQTQTVSAATTNERKLITTSDIAENAVTSPKIKDGEVNTNDITDGAVTNPKVQNGAVTTDKVADNTVQQTNWQIMLLPLLKLKTELFLSSLIKSPIGGECNFS